MSTAHPAPNEPSPDDPAAAAPPAPDEGDVAPQEVSVVEVRMTAGILAATAGVALVALSPLVLADDPGLLATVGIVAVALLVVAAGVFLWRVPAVRLDDDGAQRWPLLRLPVQSWDTVRLAERPRPHVQDAEGVELVPLSGQRGTAVVDQAGRPVDAWTLRAFVIDHLERDTGAADTTD